MPYADIEKRRECKRKYMRKYSKTPKGIAVKQRHRAMHRVRINAQQLQLRRATPDKTLDQTLRTRYGITLLEYNEMLKNQQGLCAICGKPENMLRNGKLLKLAVDHIHNKYGKSSVRALLCSACNMGIGKFCENAAQLRAAADYLDKYADLIG